MEWYQYAVAGIIALELFGAFFKEGKLHAKGQETYLTIVGVVTPALLWGFMIWALWAGGFWNA